MSARKSEFATEADLCAAFLAAVPKDWTAYPETAGWDILLVRNSDGFQIGVEAKLRLNAKVLLQAAEREPCYYDDRAGPDCRAALIPAAARNDLAVLASRLLVTVLGVTPGDRYMKAQFWPSLPNEGHRYTSNDAWHELLPTKRHPLPDYVPDVAAGEPAPLQLTHWKVQALRIAVLLAETGYVDRADFKRLRIDIRRWIEGRWLQPTAAGFVAGPQMPPFQKQHPRVWEEIRTDVKSWRRPDVLMRVA